MRAVYLDHNFEQNRIELSGEEAHHLLKVVRVKNGEEILGLNGKGTIAKLVVTEIGKKNIIFIVTSTNLLSRARHFDLAIGKTKKEAMDLVLKQAVELGIGKVYILETQYSQRYQINHERIRRILISAMEQSNNPYMPEILEADLNSLLTENYDSFSLFSLREAQNDNNLTENSIEKSLIFIGPEGGFSSEEEEQILNTEITSAIHIPTNIMRAPTAVSCAVGYLLGVRQ